MTNEELAIKAQSGDSAALLQLWKQNTGLAAIFSQRRYIRLMATGNMRGVEFDNLMQAAFLGLVNAVEHYDPAKGDSFTTYWEYHVKNEFNALLGVKTSKIDALDCCLSLDAPLDDSPDSETLESIVADPSDVYAAADEKIWRAQLHEALERALSRLDAEDAEVLKLRYYDGLTYTAIEQRRGLRSGAARVLVERARRLIRSRANREYKELEQYADLRTNFYFTGNVERQESPVEVLAEQRENIRRLYMCDLNVTQK